MGIESLSLCWPEWEIIEKLGAGQFGEVYKCKKSWENIEVFSAIKVISIPKDDYEHRDIVSEGIDFSYSAEYYRSIVEDFTNEISLMESIKGHSNIVSIEDFTIVPKVSGIGWDVLIRMELLNPLSDFTAKNTITQGDVLKIGIDLCNALEICNRQNIIHRDIKPANIFYNDAGIFKLGDFGIARRLEHKNDALSSKGTPAYLAPEVLIYNQYDARVDIYSLGIVLYQLLNNNKIPFLPTASEGRFVTYNDKKSAVDRRISGEPLPPPQNASAQVAAVILKACSFNPAERYSTPAEFRQELSALLHQSVTGETANMNNTNYQPPVNNDFSSSEYHTTKFEGYPDFTGNNKKKNNSAKYAVMGVVIAVLLAAVSVLGFLLLKTDKPEKITTMLENGQYSKAYDYYIEEYGRGNADDALIDALKIRINDLEADFNDELIEAEEVLEELDTLKNMKIKEIQDMLDELISYISAFNDGDNQQSDTVEAVTQQPDTTATTAAPTTEKPLQTEPIEEEQSYPAPVIISATTLYGDVLPSSNVNINRSFDADKTIDGYYDSCWCVTTGNEAGAGGKIRYDLQAKSKLSGVKLVNGNLYKPVEEELYLLNGQVEYFTLTFSDGSKKQFLASYNRSAAGDFQYFTFDTPVYTDYIIFTVDTGYPGEYYGGNVCLGEFDVF